MNERHKSFVQEVVLLARQHKIEMVSGSFRDDLFAYRNDEPKDYQEGTFEFNWSRGRHGAKSPISLSVRDNTSVEEKV